MNLLCLGENTPINVIEGFFRRIWRNLGVDKVSLISHGIFIVRLKTMENRDRILNNPRPFIDFKNPVFLKAWVPDMEICKEEIRSVLIWVQIRDLDFKYWGEKSLSKFVSMIGKYVRVDQTTQSREKLQFSKVLVEVGVSQQFPEVISFINEKKEKVQLHIEYGLETYIV